MATIQGPVRIYRLPDGELVGRGRGVIKRWRQPNGKETAVGTATIEEWHGPEPAGAREPHRLEFEDGRWLEIACTSYKHTSCGPTVMRFDGVGRLMEPTGPPAAPATRGEGA